MQAHFWTFSRPGRPPLATPKPHPGRFKIKSIILNEMTGQTLPAAPIPDALIQKAIEAVEALAWRATVPLIVEDGNRAESVGTGTLFEVEGAHFIVTAEHVGRHIAQYQLGVPCGPNRREIWFLGEGVVTRTAKYDVAVYRIDAPDSVSMLKQEHEFLTLDNVDLGPKTRTTYFLHGYPTDLSPKVDDEIKATPIALVTTEYDGDLTDFPLDARPYDQQIDLLLKQLSTSTKLDGSPPHF
jgi:hypothetical protein